MPEPPIMRRILFMLCVFLYAAGCDSRPSPLRGNGSQAEQPAVIITASTLAIKIGEGIISPYKIIGYGDDSRMLLITGGGENFGKGALHLIDSSTLKDISSPLPLGVNPSDIAWLGEYLIVACRGSDELLLVDVNGWFVVNRYPTVSQPISVAVLPNGMFGVVSVYNADREKMQLLRVSNGAIEKLAEVVLPGSAYKVTAGSDGRYFYVNIGTGEGKIIELNADDLSTSRVFPTGNSPSFGSLVLDGHLIATDTNGYIYNIDLNDGSIQKIDLAISLGLDRAALPVRGIYPMDIIQIGPNLLFVINNRQDSVLLNFNSGELQTIPVAKFPLGAYGTYLDGRNEVYMTRNVANMLVRIKFTDPLPGTAHTVENFTTGTSIKSALRLNSRGLSMLVALDSAGNLHVINEATLAETVLPAPVELTWDVALPLQEGPDGTLVLVAVQKTDGKRRLIRISLDGAIISDYPVNIENPVFSLRTSGSLALLIGRLQGEVEVIDLSAGSVYRGKLSHTRPRAGIVFPDGEWLVVHDTNPDFGYTLGSISGGELFSPYAGSGWLSDVIEMDDGTVVASDFTGELTRINRIDLRRIDSVLLSAKHIIGLFKDGDKDFWAVSTIEGAAQHVLFEQKKIDVQVDADNMQAVLPAPEQNKIWAVTDKDLLSFSLQ